MHIRKAIFYDLISHKQFFSHSFRHTALLLFRLAFLACFEFAMNGSQALAFEAPPFRDDVLDEAGVLSKLDKDALRSRILEIRERTGILAAIYVARGLQQDSIESAAVATFEKWKLGKTGKDNGLLVLIVPSERKMRIEVGYGLESFITDALSKRIIDEIYKPAFRDQQYAEGLLRGFAVMEWAANRDQHVGVTPAVTPTLPSADWTRMPRYFGLTFSFNLVPPLLYLLAIIYGRKKGRRESGTLWNGVRLPFIIASVLGATFGLIIGLFGALSAGDPETMRFFAFANILFAGLAILPFAFKARRFVFESVNRRHLARIRLIRIRKRSKEARKIFGIMFEPKEVSTHLGGAMRAPRNSGSWSSSISSSTLDSTSSSSSSSSGGGSSGGGGASGNW